MAISEKIWDDIKNGVITDINYRSLGDVNLNDDDVTKIAEILKTNTTVTSFSVNTRDVTSISAYALAEALKTNTTLLELDLTNTPIGDAGIIALLDGLDTNTTLSKLALTQSGVSAKGAKAAAQFLVNNTSINSFTLNGNPIGDEGGSAFVEVIRNNTSLAELSLNGCGIAYHQISKLLSGLEENRSLASLNLGSNKIQTGEGLADVVKEGGNKSLGYLKVYSTCGAEEYFRENDSIAHKLALKFLTKPEELSTIDFIEINERLPNVALVLVHHAHNLLLQQKNQPPRQQQQQQQQNQQWQWLPEAQPMLAKILIDLKLLAAEHDVDIEIPSAFQSKQAASGATPTMEQPLLTDSEYQNEAANGTAKILTEAQAIATKHNISTADLLGYETSESLNLFSINQFLEEAQQAKQQKNTLPPLHKARLEFTNHVLIPNIDYFVVSALQSINSPEEVDFSNYPNIERIAGAQYDLLKFQQNARQRQTESASLNFDYLRDPAQGDHMQRLHRALSDVNGTISGYEDMFHAINKQIADIESQVDKQRELAGERGKYLLEAKKGNEFRTDRIHEYRLRQQSGLDVAQIKKIDAGGRTAMQTGVYIAAKFTKGIPLLEGITEMASEWMGVPTVKDYTNAGHSMAITKMTAEREARMSGDVIDYYAAKQVNTDLIEKEIATINKGVLKLRENTEFKRFEQDKTKQKAVAEAFVNKLMLTFGKHMSDSLQEICEEQGIKKIDDFFAALGNQPRYQEAFTNLCFGIADSNDLSIIFAETAVYEGKSNVTKVAAEFVETVLKPQVSELYSHASKVDLIYQANLTGLGTNLHDARHMIRGEHDIRVRALFGDSFGVDSQLGDLTVRGAVDVKNLFDYYMHRHGRNILTDTKIHDGLVTGNKALKRVNILNDDQMEEHKELAISSRGYRQNGPDISDMFLRICGYEYFVPQAPNGIAQGNIMANNPEAPAAYGMSNKVIQEFIHKLSFSHINDYREKVGSKSDSASKLDNLVAQTFMDFFAETGAIHAADSKLGMKRADLKIAAAKETGTFGFAYNSYERMITKDALGRFDLFLEIYKHNLENQMRDASVADKELLKNQIASVAEITQQQLNPTIVEPGSQEDRHRARLANHTFENTYWRGAM